MSMMKRLFEEVCSELHEELDRHPTPAEIQARAKIVLADYSAWCHLVDTKRQGD